MRKYAQQIFIVFLQFVSSAPQIRYPDCYGIDMAKLGDLLGNPSVAEVWRVAFKGIVDQAQLQF